MLCRDGRVCIEVYGDAGVSDLSKREVNTYATDGAAKWHKTKSAKILQDWHVVIILLQ